MRAASKKCKLLTTNSSEIHAIAILTPVAEAFMHACDYRRRRPGPSHETPALCCWMREARTASAEVDYVIAQGQQILPVEIKAGKSGTLKSLHIFLEEKHRRFGLRFDAALPSVLRDAPLPGDPGQRYGLLSLPLYMVGQTRRLSGDYLR